MLKALLALIAAALFAGAALYISLAEHPARMRLDDRAALAQWRSSYARAAPMQAGLALVSFLLGLWAWMKIDDFWLLAGALLIGSNLPFTVAIILPTNRRMHALAADADARNIHDKLDRWGKLHAIRTVLGLAAVCAYLAAFLQP